LSDRIRELENKLSSYDEKSLSKGASPAMGDKEKIAYLSKHKNTPIGTYLGALSIRSKTTFIFIFSIVSQ